MSKRVVVGSDHGGYIYKEMIKKHLMRHGYEVIDVGCSDETSCDYPDFALPLAQLVVEDDLKGILVCGTGIGMSIAANKVEGIRASLCSDTFSAKMTRLHNDSNILCLGQRVIGEAIALDITDTWLGSGFEGGRHHIRVEKIMKMEEK